MKILCDVYRGESIESTHQVYAAVLDEHHNTIFTSGNPNHVTCIRSALKPFQASASVETGATEAVRFSSEELALMCASHNGEDVHIKTARSMLNKIGLTIKDYECGSHPPYEKNAKHHLIKTNTSPNPLHNNCSGKHAGMLCLGKYFSNTKNYTHLNHPVQKTILKQIERYSKTKPVSIGVDGCSAPTPFFDLFTMAKMYQILGNSTHPELNTLFHAMATHPYLIGGKNRFDTEFISTCNGRAVSKVGGEAIHCVSIKTKKYGPIGMAFKVLDGNIRALAPAILATLKYLDIISNSELSTLKRHEIPDLKNHNKTSIGKIITRII
jgi:L-asparaginase II